MRTEAIDKTFRCRLGHNCALTTFPDGDNELLVEFQKGDVIEFVVISHPQRFVNAKMEDDYNLANIQFDNGTVAYGVAFDWFDEIEEV